MVYEEGEVIEPEEWRNPEEQSFNHQALVMSGIKKCLELGSKEMREGYWDEIIDKNGNTKRTYHEDTRKSFIESVKSLLMVVECDFDDEATKKVNAQKKYIAERKKFWMEEEWRWWSSLSPVSQQQYAKQGKHVVKGMFNSKLNFDNYFYEDELNAYREICSEINKLTKRLDFYGTEGYEA